MKRKVVVCVILIVIALIGFLVYPFLTLSGPDLKNVVNASDMRIIQQTADDIRSIQQWSPRFADEKQIDFLVDQILQNHGKAQTIAEFRLEHTESGEQSAANNAVIDYHNELIRVLDKEGRLPSLKKLEAKPRAELKEFLKKKVDQIVDQRKLQDIERRLTTYVVYSPDAPPKKNLIPPIQKALERNHVQLYPKHSDDFLSWITCASWSAPKNWVKNFLIAVETDISPVIKWHQETNNCKELFFDKDSKCGFLLRLNNSKSDEEQLFQEGWVIRGDYTLFYYMKEGCLTRQYDTGLTIYDVTFLPKNKSVVNQKDMIVRDVYLNRKKAYKIVWKPANVKFNSERVERFLYAINLPDCWNITISKIQPENSLESLTESFSLFHNSGFFQKWKSPTIQLAIGKDIDLKQIQDSLDSQMQGFRNVLWEEELKDSVSYLGLQWQVSKKDELYKATFQTELNKDFPLTGEVFLDKDCQIYATCAITNEVQNQVTLQLKSQQESALINSIKRDRAEQDQQNGKKTQSEDLLPEEKQQINDLRTKLDIICSYANLSKLQFEQPTSQYILQGSLTGSIPIGANQERFTVSFYVNRNGNVDFSNKAEIERLCNLDLSPVEEEIAKIVPEETFTENDLQELVNKTIATKHPALGSIVQVNTGSTNGRLWFRLTFNLSDYIPLSTLPCYVGNENDVISLFENEDQNPVLAVPELAEEQWSGITEHPRFGRVFLELVSWNPSAQKEPIGEVQCTFPFMGERTDIHWLEPLFIVNSQWVQVDEASLLEQTNEEINSVLETVQRFIETQNEINIALYWDPEAGQDVTDVIRIRPFRFACNMFVQKPLGIPVKLTAGRIWVQSDSVEYPKRFKLSSDETLWMKYAGVSNPVFDLDLEEKAINVSATFTPPLKNVSPDFKTIEEQYAENDELIDLSEYTSPELSSTEEMFGDSFEESNNPWENVLRIDAGFNGNLTRKAIGGKGALYFHNGAAAGAGVQISPRSLEGNISLLDFEDEYLEDGTIISNPLTFDGDFKFSTQELSGDIRSNWLGFMGSGHADIQFPENKPIDFGVGLGFPAPFSIPLIMDVNGRTSLDLEQLSGGATGTVPNPFASVIGTLRFGFHIWRNSDSDRGFKLIFEWIYPDGTRGTFEKEYPDLASVDPDELMKELEEEILKHVPDELNSNGKSNNSDESKNGSKSIQGSQPTEKQLQQLSDLALQYPDLQQTENLSKPEDDYSRAKALDKQTLNKENDIVKKMKMTVPNSNDSAESEETPPLQYGNVKVIEKEGRLIFIDANTEEELFDLSKYDMGIYDSIDNDNGGRNYKFLIGKHPANGSGVIIYSSLKDYFVGRQPVFKRVRCSDSRTVSDVETIYTGDWNVNAPMVLSTESEQEIANRINNFQNAFYYLWFKSYYKTSKQLNSDNNISYFWKNETKLDDNNYCVTEASVIYSDPISYEDVFISHRAIPDESDRLNCLKAISRIHKPSSNTKLLFDFTLPLTFTSESKFTLITKTINLVNKQSKVYLQFIDGENDKMCEVTLEEGSQLRLQVEYLMNLYSKNPDVLGENCTCYFGQSGIATLSSTNSGERILQLIPQTVVRSADENFIPKAITAQDWKACQNIDVSFLPESLQVESQREKITLDDLAKIAVRPWERPAMLNQESESSAENAPSKASDRWIAEPMGLLIQLGNSNEQ